MTFDPTKVTLGADTPTTPTSSTRDPWQEALTKFRTVPASKVLEAADVIRGMNGSWAAQYIMEPGYRDSQGDTAEDAREPSSRVVKASRLGQPGVPEINFDPYSYGTNRFAHKGGSLLGHPLSFSVLGPTLKRDGVKFVNWQWRVTDNSGTPLTGDELTLDDVILDPDLLNVLPRTFGLLQRYGISALTDVPDGLYVVITQTGEIGNITNPATGTPTGGGTGDGFVFQDAPPVRVALQSNLAASKYEIFRVVDLATRLVGPEPDTLILDPEKRLADHFTVTPGQVNVVRAVMLLEPKATRLLAVPDSGETGAERVFVVVPPEMAANTDQHYPYSSDPAQPSQPQGWTGDSFEEPRFSGVTADGSVDPYSAYEYQEPPRLPVPRRIGTGKARLNGEWTPTGVEPLMDVGPGRMLLVNFADTRGETGQIIHVYDVKTRGNPRLVEDSEDRTPDLDSMLGWFEIVRVIDSERFVCRRVAEVDPIYGHSYFGNSSLFQIDSAPPPVEGDRIELHYTVHESISQLWDTTYFDIDKVESARLTNLINPDWTERLTKDFPPTQGRADRAIFDTASSDDGAPGSNANPGSLLDLGFRVVLYPATVRDVEVPYPDDSIGWNPADPNWGRTQTVTKVVPDFNRPVDSNEVVLDPTSTTLTEKQFVEIDYSNGLVRLSHAPTVGGDLWPTTSDVFSANDNPRGELVIFAACVPYSKEAGQLGSSVRATASPPTPNRCELYGMPDALDQQDVYGQRIYAPLRDQTLTSGGGITTATALLLYGLHGDKFPETGFVDIVLVEDLQHEEGSSLEYNQVAYYPSGTPAFTTYNSRGATFGYYGVIEDPTGAIFGAGPQTTGLLFPYGGGVTGDTIDVDLTDNQAVAVLRRDVVTPNNVQAILGTPYQYDSTYGDAWRANALRFENSTIRANADGSTTVSMESPIAIENRQTLGDLYSTWILGGGEISYSIGATVDLVQDPAVIIADGKRMEVPRGEYSLPAADGLYYLYLDSTNCWIFTVNATLPLPYPADILLGMAELTGFPGAPSVEITDLRNPLDDVDRRWDVTVGKLGDGKVGWAGYAPHFDTMAEAVAYVNNTMAPRSGTADRHYRIRVVGPTDEAAADLPIDILTDGLIVEGANRLLESYSGGSGDPVEIRWDADSALFDFNSRHGIVFRNLTFKWTGATPGTLATPTRVVFTQGMEPPATTIIIDHCAVFGYVQGLLSIQATNRITDLTVSNCMTEEALDFGVYAPGGANTSNTWKIYDNVFNAYAAGGFMTTVGAITINGINDAVVNNYINGFEKGVLVRDTASGADVIRNRILNTTEEGIVLEGGEGVQVSGNQMTSIFTSGGAQRGILVEDGSKHKIDTNLVELDGSGVGDFAINVEGTGEGLILTNNNVVGDDEGTIRVAVGETRVRSNKCKNLLLEGTYIQASDNVVDSVCKLLADAAYMQGNTVTSLEAGYDIDSSTLGYTEGHYLIGNSLGELYLGSNCRVHGNYIGTVYVYNQCKLVGNDIQVSLQDFVDGPGAGHPGTVASLVVIDNNIINSIGDGADGIFKCTLSSWIDNNIGGASGLRISGSGTLDRLQAVGNRISGELYVGSPTADANYSVVGRNIVGSSSDSFFYGEHLEVSDNIFRLGGLQVAGDDSTFTGNSVEGTLVVDGSRCTITGNWTSNTFSISSGNEDCTVTGNRVPTLQISSPSLTVSGNQVSTDLSLLTGSGLCTVESNIIGGTLNISAAQNQISANQCNFMSVGAGLNCITGNDVTTTIDVNNSADNNSITGNRVNGSGGVSVDLNDSVNNVLTGNHLDGDVNTTAGSTNGTVIVGNRIDGAVTGTQGDAIVVGNRVTGNIFGVGPGGPNVENNDT